MKKAKILIIEDDADIRDGIRILLESEDYETLSAGTGEEGLALVDDAVDLIVLDVMLPGMSGFEVCKKLREKSFAPVLFLTAKSQEEDKLAGLRAGGDDYLTKPFSYSELIGRIDAHVRRYRTYQGKERGEKDSAGDDSQVLSLGGITIDNEFNEVYKGDAPLYLSDIEYRILKLLMENAGRIFSTERIYENVWNEPYFYNNNNTVMVHIRNLRLKIEDDPNNPRRIVTVWGKGYKYDAPKV